MSANATWKEFISRVHENHENLVIPLGRDELGRDTFVDISKLPHLLIAGSTGSGKSNFLHVVINSLILKNGPENLRLILSDVKRVELGLYKDLPHSLTKVLCEPRKTVLALKWLDKEMDRRFDLLDESEQRDIESYHMHMKKSKKAHEMPYIVMIIDEIADCMSQYGKETEQVIISLTQASRAVGIHVIASTSRPSLSVLTGLMKAMIPARVIFRVGNAKDSKSLLDVHGAENLQDEGKALFTNGYMTLPMVIQTPLISEEEIKDNVSRIKKQYPVQRHESEPLTYSDQSEETDELFDEAKRVAIEAGQVSSSYLQRKLRIGYARTARLMDLLEEAGIIGPARGAEPRKILASKKDN